MTDILPQSGSGSMDAVRSRGLALMRAWTVQARDAAVWLWVFSGGIILFEPSPYEFFFLPMMALAIAAGLRLYRSTTPLLLLLLPFAAFGLIAAFQVRYIPLVDAFIFVVVTIFLLLTSYFVANFVAEAPKQRMEIINKAYLAIATISAAIGLLAYLRLMPFAEMFLLYDRAKGMFKDPNVYGPFLVLPAMFILRRMFLQSEGRLLNGAMLLLLLLGVFVSFSRAAWGHFAASAMLVFVLCFWLEARATDKVRMMIIAVIGAMVVLIALAGLLSIPAVSSLFEQRASMTQAYDTGETGRFGRQGYAFELALNHPWGIGPTEFSKTRIMEQPHNTYVSVFHGYGWGGGFCYYLLVIFTLWRGVVGLRDETRRYLLIPVLAVYIPLVIQSGLIDTDHWRHYFLVVGLIWGLTANPDTPRSMAPQRVRSSLKQT